MQRPNEEDFETVPCPQCACDDCRAVTSTEPNRASVGRNFAVVQCSRCGLTYSSPRLRASALAAAYADSEADHGPDAPRVTPGEAGALRQWWRRATQRQLVIDAVERGPVLDVGCGFGDALLELKQRGFEVRGIESSRAGVRVCRERGIDVLAGTVESVDLPDGYFQTIVMSHVLEHIAAPMPILRKLRAALAPGGRLAIAVPNHRGVVARVFGAAWHGWDPPFHLTHFDAHTLTSMLNSAGFRVTGITFRGAPEDVTRSMAKALRRPVTALWLRVALLPGSLLLGSLALGGEICAVAEREDHD